MDVTVTYDVGHAHVAAVRVLHYRNGRPPTIEEVAEELGSKTELTNHRLRALERAGIVTIVENPFEAHVSVRDHLALEKLPAEADENALSDAVADFRKRQAEKAEEQMRVFEETDEDREKREKHGAMEKDLKAFRAKKAKKAPWEQ
jgi:DNA-directed RNA polymerase specialized sigma subunit